MRPGVSKGFGSVRLAHMAAMVFLVAAVAACSGKAETTVSVQNVVAAAASKSESALSFHLTERGTESVPGAPGLIRINGSGDFDLSSQRASLTIQTQAPSGTISLLQIGQRSWIRSALYGTGDKWISANDSGDDGSGGASLSAFPNPAKMFATLKSGATSVTFLGSVTVDATETKHYRMSVPTALFNNLGGKTSGAASPSGSTAVDLWVDANDLIRRLSATVDDSGTISSFTLDFTDYGQSLDIQPPPANDIGTIPDTPANLPESQGMLGSGGVGVSASTIPTLPPGSLLGQGVALAIRA